MSSANDTQHNCPECQNSFGSTRSKCLNGGEGGKQLYPTNRESMYLLQKPADNPLMVYERAALFLEQFHESRKRFLHNVRSFNSEFVPDQGGRDAWSANCNHFQYNVPRPISLMDSNLKGLNAQNNRIQHICADADLVIRNENDEDWESCLAPMQPQMICQNSDLAIHKTNDDLGQMIESTLALNRKLSTTAKNQEPSICFIAFISMLWVIFLGKIINTIQTALDYIKDRLAFYIIRSWSRWDMNALLKKKECAKMSVLCFSPIMAVFGAFYSCIWIAYTINKTLKKPVPDKFVKKFNFKRLFQEDPL